MKTKLTYSVLAFALIPLALAQDKPNDIAPAEAKGIAQEAWVFGMPLVYIATQIDLSTHVTKPERSSAPINQFVHYREFPDASNRSIVGLNVDTLYSLGSLDLAQEPLVLSIPEMGNRFWLM